MEWYSSINWKAHEKRKEIEKGYDQTIYTFDIETSNGYIFPNENVVRAFDYNLPPSAYKEAKKVSLCYEWQFGIDNKYYFGRELKDFMRILDKLDSTEGIKIIWVHNLGFEQVALMNLFFPTKIFARDAHKIIYMEYSEKVIFRCSYQLTHLSLAAWGMELGLPKIGGYDYVTTIRTPYTALSKFEEQYGQRDIEIVRAGIEKKLDIYKLIQKIPLTQTGCVRGRVNNLFKDDAGYRFKMARLLPKDARMYIVERESFSGGNVHCNYYYADVLIDYEWCRDAGFSEDELGVSSADIASSYPYCMLTTLFPMSPWRVAKNPMYYLENDKFCCLLQVKFTGIKTRGHIDYISYSKVFDIAKKEEDGKLVEDAIVENGRINYLGGGSMVITDIDYKVIRRCYSGKIDIEWLWYSRGGYLDKRYLNFILDLYGDKTQLKGIEGKEDIYMYSKQLLNGLYGDMVSSIAYPDTILKENGEWDSKEKNMRQIDEVLNEKREKPWKLKSRFAWGCFVTAAARANHYCILEAIDGVEGATNHVVYYDTDSVYYLGNHDKEIEAYNKRMVERIDKVLESVGIDPERSRPMDKKGVKRQVGILEVEHRHLTEFKAVRAKCYGYRDERGELCITVSGVSKKNGVKALKGDLNRLTDGLTFDYEACGKSISNYNVNQPRCVWRDNNGVDYVSDYKYGLCLQPTTYTLSLGQDFYDTLDFLGALSTKLSGLSIDRLHKLTK